MPKQFPSGFLVAVLLTASGLLWAVMFFGPLAHLSRLSGGMMPFDIRPGATATLRRARSSKPSARKVARIMPVQN